MIAFRACERKYCIKAGTDAIPPTERIDAPVTSVRSFELSGRPFDPRHDAEDRGIIDHRLFRRAILLTNASSAAV
jgi:hypothetical protein